MQIKLPSLLNFSLGGGKTGNREKLITAGGMETVNHFYHPSFGTAIAKVVQTTTGHLLLFT